MKIVIALLCLLLAACAQGPNVSKLSQKAADSPESVLTERVDANNHLLAFAVRIRSDRTASEARFEATRVNMHEEAVRLAKEAGASGYALISEQIWEKVNVQRVLDATAREPQAFVREWKIEIGDAARPRSDGRAWIPAR